GMDPRPSSPRSRSPSGKALHSAAMSGSWRTLAIQHPAPQHSLGGKSDAEGTEAEAEQIAFVEPLVAVAFVIGGAHPFHRVEHRVPRQRTGNGIRKIGNDKQRSGQQVDNYRE